MAKETKKQKTKQKKEKIEKKPIWEEFKEFILRGNVIELAVGLTVGAAFTTLVKSLVDNVVMPPIGLLLSGEAFAELYINLSNQSYESLAAAEEAGAPVLKYGQFIGDLLNFVIIALVIFFLIKVVNRFYRRAEAEE